MKIMVCSFHDGTFNGVSVKKFQYLEGALDNIRVMLEKPNVSVVVLKKVD